MCARRDVPRDERTLTVRVHDEGSGLWAEVLELPGCFASGDDWRELDEAVTEALLLYLSGHVDRIEIKEWSPRRVPAGGVEWCRVRALVDVSPATSSSAP
jgi:predicted RNase H-like HicB family nuclease